MVEIPLLILIAISLFAIVNPFVKVLRTHHGDATLVFNLRALDGGTLQTVRFAQALNRPHCVVQLDDGDLPEAARQAGKWLEQGRFHILNIAGPREEKRPSIYSLVLRTLSLIQSDQFRRNSCR